MGLAFELQGWSQAPALVLDHECFAYAGQFRTPTTGKAVVTDDGTVVAAAAVSEDRTDAATLRIRYLTVRTSRRGERIGPRLVAFVRKRAHAAGYRRVTAAVNNPIAYEAFYRAGFVYTGNQAGIESLLLTAPPPGDPASYREGLGALAHQSLPEHHRAVLQRGLRRGPPTQLSEAVPAVS